MNVKVVSRYLHETRIWQDVLKRRDVPEEKQKLSVQTVKSDAS